MIYLYAALGVAMMAGIMAIFEMGLSLTGQSLLPTPFDVYFVNPTEAKRLDEQLLIRLANPDDVELGLSGQDLCDAINQADPGQYAFEPIVNRKSPWDQGCQFETFYEVRGETVSHKILIKPPSQGTTSLLPYELFSCTSTRDGYQCSFEPSEAD